jgi:hypothetical protein
MSRHAVFWEPDLYQALVLSGYADVLAQSSLLESLAERCDQPGAMNWLGFFLAASSFKGKHPYLVLMMKSGADTHSRRLDDVHAAVLLFEYRVLGMSTGAFSTDDWAGFRTVIAPEAERAAMSVMAADTLLARGAQMVLISYSQPRNVARPMMPVMRSPAMWVSGKRPVAMTLLLEPTLKETLARLGKSTRFNLGYYRRRLEAAEPCEFVDHAGDFLQVHELEGLNHTSLNPIDPGEFRLQYDCACNLPGGFLLGLRNREGKWLSLIGGWRQGDVTVLHWQMNAAGYEKFSLGTAMRSYFLEHEVERGAKKLIYYGGTPHSMGNSFEREEVTDLLVRRRTLQSNALLGVARLLASIRKSVGINSLLVQMVGSAQLRWGSVQQPSRAVQPQQVRP